MLTGPLPALIDHRKMASQQKTLEGSLPVKKFVRLSDMLNGDGGDVHLKLDFSRRSQRKTHVSGTVTAAVELICQKCLNPTVQTIACEVSLDIVGSEEEAASLDDNLDVIVCVEKHIQLVDLVEDELILGVPMIARHTEGECPENEYQQEAEAESLAPVDKEDTHRPFAGLAEAMQKNTDDNKES